MSFLENLMAFAHTEKYGIWQKIFFFLAFVISVIVLDKYLGFSFFSYNNSKVEILERISDLKKSDPSLEITNELKRIEAEVLKHQRTYISLFKNISIIENETNGGVTIVSKLTAKRNILILTASWIWILLAIAMPFLLYFDKSANSNIAGKFGILLAMLIMCGLFGLIFTWLFSLIPIFKNINLNYAINFIGSSILVGILASLSNKKKSKN